MKDNELSGYTKEERVKTAEYLGVPVSAVTKEIVSLFDKYGIYKIGTYGREMAYYDETIEMLDECIDRLKKLREQNNTHRVEILRMLKAPGYKELSEAENRDRLAGCIGINVSVLTDENIGALIGCELLDETCLGAPLKYDLKIKELEADTKELKAFGEIMNTYCVKE
jgi:hypothetical protein